MEGFVLRLLRVVPTTLLQRRERFWSFLKASKLSDALEFLNPMTENMESMQMQGTEDLSHVSL